MTPVRQVPTLDDQAVAAYLRLDGVIACLETAFRDAHRGRVQAPPRVRFGPQPGCTVMVAHDEDWAIVKSFAPGSTDPPLVSVYDLEQRRLVAQVASGALSRLRTGAVSALAAGRLVREGSRSLTIVGAGRQGTGHVDVLVPALGLTDLRVASLVPEDADRLVEHARREHGIEARAFARIEAALDGSDIVCLTTTSREPILEAHHLHAGTHVLAIGANRRGLREVSAAAVGASRVYVDDLTAAHAESEELHAAIDAGLLSWDRVETLASLVAGAPGAAVTGCRATLFKNLGSGIADMALARLLVSAALADA